MSLSIGIIGLPNVGKSTLFNALTAAHAETSNYPFCTIEKNVGVAEVPDDDLWKLNELLQPKECVPAALQLTDIAGLVKGASQGEGLGNRFLGNIRDVDALGHIVRCFENPDIAHVDGTIDPARDVEVINTELAISDLEVAEKALESRQKAGRAGSQEAKDQAGVLAQVIDALGRGVAIRNAGIDAGHLALVKEFTFLTAKPILYVANVGEEEVAGGSALAEALANCVGAERVVTVSAEIEAEIAELPEDERKDFLSDLGLEESGLRRLARAGYRLLNLVSFYTIANEKLRAWAVPEGTKAPEAAGKVHTDMEQGFIRAEVAAYADLLEHKGMREMREHGLVKTEGRDYEILDQDVVEFLFKAP